MYVYVCIHVYVCTYIHVYMCVYIYIYYLSVRPDKSPEHKEGHRSRPIEIRMRISPMGASL